MKKCLLLSLMLMSMAVSQAAIGTTTTNYTYSANSKLAEGKWVKISIESSGIYEISYDELRSMGFSDPSQVSVFGHGGAERSIQFIDNYRRQLEDDLTQVAIHHGDEKIYFYGQGPVKMAFSAALRPYHTRITNNQYTRYAYYFLTDSQPVKLMSEPTVSNPGVYFNRGYGYGYDYFEEDLQQGAWNNQGQLWWGRNFAGLPRESDGTARMDWDLHYKYCMPDAYMYVNTDIAVSPYQNGSLAIIMNDDTSLARSFTLNIGTVGMVKNMYNAASGLKLNVDSETGEGRGKLTMQVSEDCTSWPEICLDYWTVTYPKHLRYAIGDPDFKQEYIAFRQFSNEPYCKIAVPEGSKTFCITDARTPVVLHSEGQWAYCTTTQSGEYIVIDPSKEQKRILPGFTEVKNQNLHGLQHNGYDMLIITVEKMVEYARRLAELHEQYDGQKVLVVTQQQLFDEFTSGSPDPMAYRLMVKMLYQNSSHRLKNVLLMGPVRGDYRNLHNIPDLGESLIGYYQPGSRIYKATPIDFDFFGCVTDYINDVYSFDSIPVNVGVGYMPINGIQDGELMLSKIRMYLEQQDYSPVVNETMTFSCPGDGNLHDKQMVSICNRIQSIQDAAYGSQFAHREVWVDKFGLDASTRMIEEQFSRGKLFTVYFGHSTAFSLNNTGIYSGTFEKLNNEYMGFMFMAGCDQSSPDNFEPGIGAGPVIKSPRGLVGNVCSTRTVLSNENYELADAMTRGLFYDRGGNLRTEAPTIGEVYAQMKHFVTNESESSFYYCGDPALRVPVALGKVSVRTEGEQLRGNDVVEITGEVLNAKGEIRSDYNGFVTVKVMAPSSSEEIPNSSPVLMIDYDDYELTSNRAEVKDGKFRVKVVLPDDVDDIIAGSEEGETLRVLVGTWDPTKYSAASGLTDLVLATNVNEESAQNHDTEKPRVSLNYDQAGRQLEIEISDNVGVIGGIGSGSTTTVTIDGEPITLSEEFPIQHANYSAKIPVWMLTPGLHTAVAVSSDEAGNVSNPYTLQFSVPTTEELTLTALDRFAIDSMSFRITGWEEMPEGLEVIITDRCGKTVGVYAVTGRNIECDLTGVAAGTYFATVRADGANGVWNRSNRVEFAVID